MIESVKACIANLKHKPGVYLMKDENDHIIYVGKAKDLYKRVSQYFLRPQTGKVAKMVSLVHHFDTILTNNEKEALILEFNLIHEHLPRYNILLKDDSHYPYIALRKKADPYVTIKRDKKDNNYSYFGPFPSSSDAYQVIDVINKIFPIRKCKSLPSSACLYYHMGQCLAPCINKIDDERLIALRKDIMRFLSGDNTNEYNMIKEKMLEAAKQEKYELANDYKNILKAIEHINQKQNVEILDKVERDIFAYSVREGYFALTILTYRKGQLLGKKSYVNEVFDNIDEEVAYLILQYYHNHALPKEIIINNDEIIRELKIFIDDDVNIYSISKGKLNDLVLYALDNAKNAIDQYFLSARLDDDKVALLDELGSLINISCPYHIELFDNSHLQGDAPVGALVAFVNGEPCKKLYRKFNIEHEEARNDIASMYEVVKRHYLRNKNENKKMPDLILVDGATAQIKAAKRALMDIEVDIPVYGLAKNNKHQTNALIDDEDNVYNIDNKALFFLLTRMQDEVHRFAISFHHNKRKKQYSASILDNISGLGEHRKALIIKAYPSLASLKEASINELSQFIPKEVAERLYEKIHHN